MFIEASERPILRPAANASAGAEYEDNGLKKEEELGIFQVLDRLEEVTNMLISR